MLTLARASIRVLVTLPYTLTTWAFAAAVRKKSKKRHTAVCFKRGGIGANVKI
jgi:hypothetical protein